MTAQTPSHPSCGKSKTCVVLKWQLQVDHHPCLSMHSRSVSHMCCTLLVSKVAKVAKQWEEAKAKRPNYHRLRALSVENPVIGNQLAGRIPIKAKAARTKEKGNQIFQEKARSRPRTPAVTIATRWATCPKSVRRNVSPYTCCHSSINSRCGCSPSNSSKANHPQHHDTPTTTVSHLVGWHLAQCNMERSTARGATVLACNELNYEADLPLNG